MHTFQICFFVHSLRSDWNHGNAHFLRGLARALIQMGLDVRCYEPEHGWSLDNLMNVEGEGGIDSVAQFQNQYSDLNVTTYPESPARSGLLRRELREADIVIVHEWSSPELVGELFELREEQGFKLLFHDTHHRACSSAEQLRSLRLNEYDGVLAFGDALRRLYTESFGIPRVWTFHEAADTTVFRPITRDKTADVLWIGNWGDNERAQELMEFLVEPARALPHRHFRVHGVRYPEAALAALQSAGIEFEGYLPNLSAPCAYSAARISLHVPRRQYTQQLPGIPTIRVFEALACAAPLVCSPWSDLENLFRPGADYLIARDGVDMTAIIEELLRDDAARAQLGASGLDTIRKRHTCTHRAEQLLSICEEVLA